MMTSHKKCPHWDTSHISVERCGGSCWFKYICVYYNLSIFTAKNIGILPKTRTTSVRALFFIRQLTLPTAKAGGFSVR